MKQQVDGLLRAETLLTMRPSYVPIKDAALVWDKGIIKDVGPYQAIVDRYEPAQYYDFSHHIVMPGLINTHAHLGMTHLRGSCIQAENLQSWLHGCILKKELYVSQEMVYQSTRQGALELLDGGVTCIADMYFHPAAVCRAIESVGIRALVGITSTVEFSVETYDLLRSLQTSFIDAAVALHSFYSTTPQLCRQAIDYARAHSLPVMMHIAETDAERYAISPSYQNEYIRALHAAGADTVPLIIAHAIHFTPEEQIALTAFKKVGVSYNPSSNLFLASGIFPFRAWKDLHIAIGIGTDSAASNNRLDLWHEMHVGWLLQRLAGRGLMPYHLLAAATAGGAAVLGFSDRIGQLKPDMAADFIAINTRSRHLLPVDQDPYALLVCAARATDVTDVFIAGAPIKRNGVLLVSQ